MIKTAATTLIILATALFTEVVQAQEEGPGSITGMVFSDTKVINGTKDPGETPVPGVGVSLYLVNEEGERIQVAETITDKDYEFLNLPYGTYLLTFTFPTSQITVESKLFVLSSEEFQFVYDVPVIDEYYRTGLMKSLGLRNPNAVNGPEVSPFRP